MQETHSRLPVCCLLKNKSSMWYVTGPTLVLVNVSSAMGFRQAATSNETLATDLDIFTLCITAIVMSSFDFGCVCAAGDLPVEDIFDEEGVELIRICLRIPREVSPPTPLHLCFSFLLLVSSAGGVGLACLQNHKVGQGETSHYANEWYRCQFSSIGFLLPPRPRTSGFRLKTWVYIPEYLLPSTADATGPLFFSKPSAVTNVQDLRAFKHLYFPLFPEDTVALGPRSPPIHCHPQQYCFVNGGHLSSVSFLANSRWCAHLETETTNAE